MNSESQNESVSSSSQSEGQSCLSPSKYKTVPSKLDSKQLQQWDEYDELLQVEREWKDHEKPYQTLPNLNASPAPVLPQADSGSVKDFPSEPAKKLECADEPHSPSHVTKLRRRPGRRFDKTKLRRRCSINGHYYNRETSVFTPPYGSTMSVWTTSLVSTQEVINMLLDKYRVECPAMNFSIFVVKDNGGMSKTNTIRVGGGVKLFFD